MVAFRRVRISYSDPDATDSDSDSDSGDHAVHDISGRSSTNAAARRKVIVVSLGGRGATGSSRARSKSERSSQCSRRRSSEIPPAAAEAEDWLEPPSSSDRICRAVAARSAAATKKGSRGGVYQRQPGRWAVDFRDHQLKVQQWFGTFPSEEEARTAYDAFEVQVRASVAVAQPPAPDARGGRAGRVKIQQPAPLRASGHGKMQQPEEPSTATTTTKSSQATASASLSSEAAPPSSSASAATPQNLPPLVVDPFLTEEDQLAGDDHFGFGLAALGHLPLPFLDGNMDFELSDSGLSLLDIGFV